MNEITTKTETQLGTPNRSMDSWATMREQATVMLKSGFLPPSIKSAEQCLAIAMTGKELGIGFMEAIRSINVIQGKPTISPQLMLALANRTGELEDIKIETSKDGAIITVKRKGRQAHIEKFGLQEATDLGLIGKDNYKKQPATMYKWRAIAANLRVTFPDVVLGLYTPEELGAQVKVGEDDAMEVVNAPTEVIKDEPKTWPHPAEAQDGMIHETITIDGFKEDVNKKGKPYYRVMDSKTNSYFVWDAGLMEMVKGMVGQEVLVSCERSQYGTTIRAITPLMEQDAVNG